MTPGFISRNAKTFEEADWFALVRLSRFLFLPIEPVADLTDEIEINQNKWIESYFGTTVTKKLEEIKEHAKSLMNLKTNNLHMLSIPPMDISLENNELIIQHLRNGIINHLNVNSETLINGDIRQFIEKLGGLNIATGGFGGIMALDRTGDIPKEIYSWINQTINKYLNIEK